MELRTEFVLQKETGQTLKTNVEKYNNTIHSSTGAKPVEAHKDENRDCKSKSNTKTKAL